MQENNNSGFIRKTIQDSIDLKSRVLNDAQLQTAINETANRLIEAFKRGNRLLIAGNGGSAADAQHIAAELTCRFNFDRPALSALALATNFSMITATGNDYGYDHIFAREIEANGRAGDVFIGISTSGNSANILRAFEVARKTGIECVGLSGQGGKIREYVDLCLNVPSTCTARIQECHILIGHILCEIVENHLFPQNR